MEAIKQLPTHKQEAGLVLFRDSRVLMQIHSTICITCHSTNRPHLEICTKRGGVVTRLRLGRRPDFTKQFVLQTDASDRGVGAVLSQCDEQGQDRPVAYFSRKLLNGEERYSIIEKECLGIKLAIQAFNTYLMGQHLRYKQTTGH